MNRVVRALLCLVFIQTGCNDRNEKNQSPIDARAQASAQPAAQAQDICALLTKEEIEAVQGSPIKDSTSSMRRDGGLRIAECFYTARDYSKSVILTTTQIDLTQQNPRRNLKELWTKTFDRDSDKEAEKEEEREGPPPRQVTGLGEEAYWSGGSLYIFTKDSFIRIAIGGPESEEAKMRKLRTLAEKVLQRF
jgi:hypothetical protein